MKTDSIFYQLFQTFPTLLFELIGETPEREDEYQFLSQEVKELSRRFDGLFLPPSTSQEDPIYFVEVQIRPKDDFYWRFFAEIFVYLGQYQPQQDWCAVALFGDRKADPSLPRAYRGLRQSQQLKVLYLDELEAKEESSLGLEIVQLMMRQEKEVRDAIVPTQALMEKARTTLDNPALQQKVLELIETVLVYKFTALSRQELEAMFGLEELKQTRYFQEVGAEFEQRGFERGEQQGFERGEQRGFERGEQQGFERGEQRGIKQGKLEAIPRLSAIGLTIAQIAIALDLDIEEVRNAIQNQENNS
ncbi:MAG: Rpn family recombination-promoting nuclease/putative transposase [Cyanobacteria bacterium SBLK]|nr:Rpn family recombination-promoting nuclease/putative transposase [Cyanobacteria bacterium SBLK]